MFSETMFPRQPLFRIPSFLISRKHRLGLTGARGDKQQAQPGTRLQQFSLLSYRNLQDTLFSSEVWFQFGEEKGLSSLPNPHLFFSSSSPSPSPAESFRG